MNGSSTAELTVNIGDVNDEVPEITGIFEANIAEEQPEGTLVPVNIIATDADENDVLSYSISGIVFFSSILGESSGSVVECLTRERGAAGSGLKGVTALWSLSKTHLS